MVFIRTSRLLIYKESTKNYFACFPSLLITFFLDFHPSYILYHFCIASKIRTNSRIEKSHGNILISWGPSIKPCETPGRRIFHELYNIST